MRLALINDTHQGARGDSTIVNEYFFEFWENTFFPYIENPANKIERVVHLGDFVDRRKYTNHNILHTWRTRFFERLPVHIDILVGNHDTPFKNTNHPNAIRELFGRYPFVEIIEDPMIKLYDEFPILLLPWINAGNQDTAMQMIKDHKASHIFGHLEIAGFEMDKGNICDHGLDRKLFDKYEAVYSGHFHHKSSDGLITYLGNQYEITWADYDDDRGFHVFDTETRTIEYIQNPYKLFYKHEYDDGPVTPIKDEEVTNKYIKIIVKSRKDNKQFDDYIENLIKLNPTDYEIVEASLSVPVDMSAFVVDESEDLVTNIGKYIDTLNTNGLNPKNLKEIVKNVHLEALQMETK